MDDRKLEIIQQLMEELQGEMEYSKDDFEERLGRKKPKVEVVKIEGKLPFGEEKAEEMFGEDLDGDSEMGEDPEHVAKVLDEGEDCDYEEEMSPEASLKKRLMKLRA